MDPVIIAMKQDLELAEYSPHTVRAYVACVSGLASMHALPLDRLGRMELRAWALRISSNAATRGQMRKHFAAAKFLFARTLGQPELVSFLVAPRRRSPLPPVLSVREVARLLDAFDSAKYRTLFSLMYGTGLRLSETCSLEIGDINADRGVIRVRAGKGGAEREVPLSPRLSALLRDYLVWVRPAASHLFVCRHGRPVCQAVARRALRLAAERAGVRHRVTPHVLRHTFATHHIDAGTELTVVQALLGHASIRSTARYVRVSTRAAVTIASPFDRLAAHAPSPHERPHRGERSPE